MHKGRQMNDNSAIDILNRIREGQEPHRVLPLVRGKFWKRHEMDSIVAMARHMDWDENDVTAMRRMQ